MYLSKSAEVLLAVPEEDRPNVGLLANYFGNTGGGRPSDNARRAVREYENGRMPYWNKLRSDERNRIHRQECMFGPGSCLRCADIEGIV